MDCNQFMTDWIWTPDWTAEDDTDVRIVYFRKAFTQEAGKLPEKRPVRISADSRYKLYVNGQFVQEGPQKALSLKEWYVDEADLAPYLKEGENVIAAEVMRFPAATLSNASPNTNDSLLHTPIPNLFISDGTGELSGRNGWKCMVNREIRVVGEDAHPAPIHAQEIVSATPAFAGWKCPGFDDGSWKNARLRMIFDVSAGDAPGNLIPRTIPAQRHTDRRFEGSVCMRDPEGIRTKTDETLKMRAMRSGYSEEEAAALATKEVGTIPLLENSDALRDSWTAMLTKDEPLVVPAHTTQIVEISAGAEECGYLLYSLAGGKGASIMTLCSECYAYPPAEAEAGGFGAEPLPTKGDRTDYRNGRLYGHVSRLTAAGYGSAEKPESYEPYWFRTFRYIQLRITTKDEPLTFLGFTYRETGYPLDVRTTFEVSDPTFAPIWDISVRTLKRCMHETYFDCPFYEQLQYAMDGRSEILYTYMTSADDRLARQAMEAFRQSQRPDGMTNSDAPTVKSNVIPGFSIYYLLMVHDHMMYFGDRALVKLHMPAIDQILVFFDRNLTADGLVGKVGGPIMRARYWSFIDWSTKWNANGGVPLATNEGSGSLTMESLLYLMGLQKAAELADYIGRGGLASEYRERAEILKAAIRKHCFGTYISPDGKETRLLQDGPGIEEYSVHSQVFGILTGVVSPEEGRAMLEATVGNEDLAQSSVSFMIYLFRAYELVGLYEKTDRQWDLWRQMVKDHMTTCVENDTDARSDCHAWASLLCYELPAVILGVRPAAPGFEKIEVKPVTGALEWARGDVVTPRGMVHVEWKKREDGTCDLTYDLP